MTDTDAISKMVSPGQLRAGKPHGGILQIWITRACEGTCYNCTQGSHLAGHSGFMDLHNFDTACSSLQDYFGVVGMFGGNPPLNPQFPELCEIMRRRIPYARRGIWTSHPRGQGAIMRQTFNPAVSNVNVHMDLEAYQEFKRDWPECNPVGLHNDSRHSPPWIALIDLDIYRNDEEARWQKIIDCDINRDWSAMICLVRGQLRAYFCEIAGAQAILHQDDPNWPIVGLPVEHGWWKRPITDFREQILWHCHRCGIPLRARGELARAKNGVEQVSRTHLDVYRLKVPSRRLQIVDSYKQLGPDFLARMTDYLNNSTE